MKKSRLTIAAVAALAVATVGGYEGLRTKAYRDVVGVPTVCYGETLNVKITDTYTVAECKAMLRKRLGDFEQRMLKCIRNPDAIPDKSYIAFLSFSYNVGVGAFCRSTLVKKLNAGDLVGACKELPRWNKAGGRVIKGLVNRRAGEMRLCLEGADVRVVSIPEEKSPVTGYQKEERPVPTPERKGFFQRIFSWFSSLFR